VSPRLADPRCITTTIIITIIISRRTLVSARIMRLACPTIRASARPASSSLSRRPGRTRIILSIASSSSSSSSSSKRGITHSRRMRLQVRVRQCLGDRLITRLGVAGCMPRRRRRRMVDTMVTQRRRRICRKRITPRRLDLMRIRRRSRA